MTNLRRARRPPAFRSTGFTHLVTLRDGVAHDFLGQSVPAGVHGFGSGLFIRAVPAAKPRADTGHEGQRAPCVRVVLAFCLAFELARDGGQRGGVKQCGDLNASLPGLPARF